MQQTFERGTMTQGAKAIVLPAAEDDLSFFTALWFWVPAGLALWAAIIWTALRVF